MTAALIAFAAAFIGFALFAARIALGPTTPDRLLGFTGSALCACVTLAAIGAAASSPALIDAALVAALAGACVSLVAAAREAH